MDELNYMLDNIESQLGKSRKRQLYDSINNYNYLQNNSLTDKSNLFLGNLDYSSLNYNNNLSEQSNINQLDKISNGGKDYELNIPYYQKVKNDYKIEKEIEPYSKNIQSDMNNSLNNVRTVINGLKIKENDIDK